MKQSIYDIPPGCTCHGDGLMGMPCGVHTVASWWISCKQFTVLVKVDKRGIITFTFAAPIVRRFVGQPLRNLEVWIQTRWKMEKIKL